MQAITLKVTNEAFFNDHVPEKIQRAILSMIYDACRNASEHCYGRFSSKGVAKDVSGHYRRGLIEDQWIGMKGLFPELAIAPVSYKRNTGTYHEITSGLVKITESCTYHPDELPREAEFRMTLATSGQRALAFDDEPEDESAQPRFMYAVLTYGIASSDKRSRPWFVRVQFLNDFCTEYVDRGIDLISKFPDVVSIYTQSADVSGDVKERPRWGKRKSA